MQIKLERFILKVSKLKKKPDNLVSISRLVWGKVVGQSLGKLNLGLVDPEFTSQNGVLSLEAYRKCGKKENPLASLGPKRVVELTGEKFSPPVLRGQMWENSYPFGKTFWNGAAAKIGAPIF